MYTRKKKTTYAVNVHAQDEDNIVEHIELNMLNADLQVGLQDKRIIVEEIIDEYADVDEEESSIIQ